MTENATVDYLENADVDPMRIGGIPDFVAEMRRFKARSGLGYKQLEDRARRIGMLLPHSTLSSALSRDALPRPDLVEAFVLAAGGDAEDVAWWLKAHGRLASAGWTDPVREPVPASVSVPASVPVPAPSSPPAPVPAPSSPPAPVSAPSSPPAPVSAPSSPPAPVSAPVSTRRGYRRTLLIVVGIVAALVVGGSVAAVIVGGGVFTRREGKLAGLATLSAPTASATSSVSSASVKPSASASLAPTAGWLRLRPVLTYGAKFCLALAESKDKLILVQEACSTSSERHFRLESVGGAATTVRIRPRSARMGTNSCVSVNDTGSYAGVYLLNCGDTFGVQSFVIEHTRTVAAIGVMYRFRPTAHPARCLGVDKRSTKSGTAIVEQQCTGSSGQEFVLEHV